MEEIGPPTTDNGRRTAERGPRATDQSSGDGLESVVRSPWSVVLIAAVAVLYAWLIYRHGSPFAAGADSSGYFNSAKLLAHGQVATQVRELPGYPPPWRFFSHMPLGMSVDRETGRLVPTYPIGLPLHLLIAAPVVGWEKTARVINALNVLAAAALLYALGRRFGLERPWALAAVAGLWTSPVWTLHALQPQSDALSVTWCLAAVYGAWRAGAGWRWALAAGASVGVAVLVRPTNLLVALPVALALGRGWRAWLGCIAGGAPFAVALAVYNTLAYGQPLTTGYGENGSDFSLAFVPHNVAHFALWLPLLAGVPVACAALGLPWVRRAALPGARRVTLLLAAWAGAFAAFYALYRFAGETWWYLRFLLPAFPPVLIAGLLVLQSFAARNRRALTAAIFLVVGGIAAERELWRQLVDFSVRDGERRYFRACAWLKANLPPDAIVASWQLSGAQFYYTDFPLLRFDQVPPDEFARIARGAQAAGRPVYAAVFHDEEQPPQGVHFAGRWTQLATIEGVAMWRLDELPPATP